MLKTSLYGMCAFLIIFGTCAAFIPIGFMDMVHESQTLIPASQVLAGKILYRDIFFQYGPLPTLLHAGAMKIFGQGLFAVRLCASFFLGFTGLFLYLSWRRIVSESAALIAIIAWGLHSYHFMHPLLAWPAVYALTFQSVAILGQTEFLVRGNWRWLFLAGSAAACSALCKQNVGVYLFGALIVAANIPPVGHRRWRPYNMVPVLAGFLTIIGLLILWLSTNGAVSAWWTDSIKWPSFWSQLYGKNSIFTITDRLTLFRLFGTKDPYNIEPHVPDLIYLLLPISCIVAFTISGIRFLKNTTDLSDVPTMGLCLVCGASWLQYYPVPGIGHVWWASAPMFVIPFYFGNFFINFIRKNISSYIAYTSVIISLLVLFLPGIVWRFSLLNHIVHEQRVKIDSATSPFNGIYLTPDNARSVVALDEAIGRCIDRSKTDPILLSGTCGMILAFVPNFLSFHPFWMLDDEHQIDVVDPDYVRKRHEFVLAQHPIIFTCGDVNSLLNEFPEYRVIETTPSPRAFYAPPGSLVDQISILASGK